MTLDGLTKGFSGSSIVLCMVSALSSMEKADDEPSADSAGPPARSSSLRFDPLCYPDTATGVDRLVVVPSPSSP